MNRVRELCCAIYTRKSSEEGLEQSFNSLDAQREACEAFILSQRQEGWSVVSTRYDDGGFSGGSMERPGLKRLLEDVAKGKVNVIVVYKVDRLTRSLADFAKIVEVLDEQDVSFVSVTQQFNTTSSMGRLTLNVLLSFAQFEREVTGERIRDKIAASKKKGMWMGGLVPLGYDLADRKLIPNQKEAALVRWVFSLYLKAECVSKLLLELARKKVTSKHRNSQSGTRPGGVPFSRGALYHLLRNRLYIGETRHRNEWYPGQHEAIVPMELWTKVQALLSRNFQAHNCRVHERRFNLLTGLLEDAKGNRFTPSYTKKNGRRYRYYVSQLVIRHPENHVSGVRRLPASEIENLVSKRLQSFLSSEEEIFNFFGKELASPASIQQLATAAKRVASTWTDLGHGHLWSVVASFLHKVVVEDTRIHILVSKGALRGLLANIDQPPVNGPARHARSVPGDLISLNIEAQCKRRGGEVHLVVSPDAQPLSENPKNSLVKAIVRAHAWYENVLAGKALDQRAIARQAGLTERYAGKVFRCAFLAPDIVEAILDGRQPRDLTFEKLTRNIPLSWAEQRNQLGFPPRV